jgi:hypothetical protein
MGVKGTMRGGVVVLEATTDWEDGTEVDVVPRPKAPKKDIADALLDWAGSAVGLPEDLAENHDHYLHGLPKKTK